MKIAITGGTGFIGSHLIKSLIDDGHQVVALVRNRQRGEKLERLVHFMLSCLKNVKS